jgi:hypothetical protein
LRGEGSPENGGFVDGWQEPEAKDVEEAGAEHVDEVDEEDVPSLELVAVVEESNDAGNEGAGEGAGGGDEGDPAGDGEPAADPGDSLDGSANSMSLGW